MRLKTNLFRHESWGKLVYHPLFDEFEAHVENSAEHFTSEKPISAGCLVTGKSDLRCSHCYGNQEGLPADKLSATDWQKVFSQLKDWGLMRVDISGGEPTTRPDIETILKSAIDAGLNVILSTNGRLLAKRGLHGIPRAVRIHVSLDSGNPLIHETNRQLVSGKPSENSFSDVSTLLSDCIGQNLRVRVLTAIGPYNCSDLLRLGEHLAGLEVPEWNISRVLPAGRALANYNQQWALSEDEISDQIRMLQNALPWMRIRYSNRVSQNGYFLLVLPDGSIATQFTDGKDKVILGNWKTMDPSSLKSNSQFNIHEHFSKWVTRVLCDQPDQWTDLEREFSLIE
jgi:MoaA/NifB/PqqE/SkfB family radical SAM enzyme